MFFLPVVAAAATVAVAACQIYHQNRTAERNAVQSRRRARARQAEARREADVLNLDRPKKLRFHATKEESE